MQNGGLSGPPVIDYLLVKQKTIIAASKQNSRRNTEQAQLPIKKRNGRGTKAPGRIRVRK
jgi:hypothetical protein